jgi:hypothetical protein
MRQSGVTTEGLPVYADLFPLVGTQGVQLEDIRSRFNSDGRVVDCPDYVAAALANGQNPRTFKARIGAAIGEVYGPDYRKQVEVRLERYL